jgi:hypothetical protein
VLDGVLDESKGLRVSNKGVGGLGQVGNKMRGDKGGEGVGDLEKLSGTRGDAGRSVGLKSGVFSGSKLL